MRNIYGCGYDLRVGYTEGFNDGLTGKANEHELPEPEWNSTDKLDAAKRPGDSPITVSEGEDQADVEISEYYKTGYNWGHFHGKGERKRLRNVLPEERFEISMVEFANCLKIFHLQIKKEYYLVGVTSLEPEAEKSYRTKFIDQFLKDTGAIKPEKSILREIQECLSENNLQRAIDKSLNYFRDQKDLGNFSFSLTLKSKLMNLRNALRNEEIEKEVYLLEKESLADSLMERIETSNCNTDLT